MSVQRYLLELGYKTAGHFKHKTTILSDIFTGDDFLVIVDRLSIFDTEFSYKLFCQQQNEWMKRFTRVYRFIEDDIEMASLFLLDADHDYNPIKTMDRENLLPDPSPLESTFETCYEIAFGVEAYEFLWRAYSFQMKNGKTGYSDYALFNQDKSWIAIEENGVSYHHPYLIKKEKYRVVLNKQNSVINSNGIVFRWDTESLKNLEKIVDEIKEFVGDLSNYITHYSFKEQRDFKLYDHQEQYIRFFK